MPVGILEKDKANVNSKIAISNNKIAQENLSVNDLLESINILLKYIKKRHNNQ